MWPSMAELFLVPCSASTTHQEKVEFWSDVYGFDLSPLRYVSLDSLVPRPSFKKRGPGDEAISRGGAII